MKVFISWSGDNSKKLAEALYSWIPSVLQMVKPYFTPSDIEKGTRWNSEIAKELEVSEVGILCVTRDNIHSDWIMFEAGALSKSIDKAHVCPILFGIHNTDLAGPLKQFQTTEFEKEDFKKLINLVNAKLGENKLPPKVIDAVFNKWWPELEQTINNIFSQLDEDNSEPIRTDRDLLTEILELSRNTSRNIQKDNMRFNPGALVDLMQKYISIHDEQVSGDGGYQDTLNSLESMKRAILHIAMRFRGSEPNIADLIEKINDLPFVHIDNTPPQPSADDDIPF